MTHRSVGVHTAPGIVPVAAAAAAAAAGEKQTGVVKPAQLFASRHL